LAPDEAVELVVATAFATLFAVVGLLSLVVAVRSGGRRWPALVLAWALLQHGLNQLTSSAAFRAIVGDETRVWLWTAAVTGHLIAVPWALLLEEIVGPGWKSSVRRTWQAFAVCAAAAIAFDAATGEPGAAAGLSQVVIAAGAFVGLVNLWPGVAQPPGDLRLVRAGYFLFMAVVIHNTLAGAGVLPWRRGAGPLGPLAFIGALAYTVVARTLRRQQELRGIEQELATARRIQTSILPTQAPELEGATVAFRYLPATSVAGDVFDFLDPSPRHTGILVADVCGHGVPAALIASMVKVATAAQKAHADDPCRVLAGIHLAVTGDLPPGHFVTAVYVYVDLERGILRHASAGHPSALVRRGADATVLPAGPTGPLLISLAPADYPVVEIPFSHGDSVVLYTDGLVEAMRADGEMFGVERLSALVTRSRVRPEMLLSELVAAASDFVGRPGAAFDDDCTLVALEAGPLSVSRSPAGRRRPEPVSSRSEDA
jgi:serine phosphatase RsbU (regulator of sigma subunit)